MSLIDELGEHYNEYKLNVNLGHICACVAEGYIMKAEQILRDNSQYRLDNKQDFVALKTKLGIVLKKVDGLTGANNENVIDSTSFLTKIIDELAKKDILPDDEIKWISLIKNTK